MDMSNGKIYDVCAEYGRTNEFLVDIENGTSFLSLKGDDSSEEKSGISFSDLIKILGLDKRFWHFEIVRKVFPEEEEDFYDVTRDRDLNDFIM